MDKGAVIKGKYRYSLWRIWDCSRKLVIFFMLNPSTADENTDDPTIRRCINFAKYWGFGGLKVVNLYGYRSTEPEALKLVLDPIGPENYSYIKEIVNDPTVGAIIAGWGCHGYNTGSNKLWKIMQLISPKNLFCLEVTKQGYPKHPLYCRADILPIPFSVQTNHKLDNGKCEYFDGGCCYGPWSGPFGEGCMLSNNQDCIHFRQVDTKRHLCDTCKFEQPTCPSDYNEIEYGDGPGNDNVIRCYSYKTKEKENG